MQTDFSRSQGLGFFVVGGLAALLIRPRVNHRQSRSISVEAMPTEGGVSSRKLSQICHLYKFWALCLSMLCFALGMLMPNIYMPLFAKEIGLTDNWGLIWWQLSMVSVSSVALSND